MLPDVPGISTLRFVTRDLVTSDVHNSVANYHQFTRDEHMDSYLWIFYFLDKMKILKIKYTVTIISEANSLKTDLKRDSTVSAVPREVCQGRLFSQN